MAAAGTISKLDDIVKIESHIFVANTKDGGSADWLPIVNDKPLPRWAAHRDLNPKDLSQLVPLGWKTDGALGLDEGLGEHPPLLQAKCLCGGVEFYITKPNEALPRYDTYGEEWWLDTNNRFLATVCPCRSCRFAAGNTVMHWANVPTGNILLPTGQPYTPNIGTMKWYRSSDQGERAFCSCCGATIFFRHDRRMVADDNGLLFVAAGLFCAPSGAKAEDWLHWGMTDTSAEESPEHARLMKALKIGFQAWAEKTHGKDAPLLDAGNLVNSYRKLTKRCLMPID